MDSDSDTPFRVVRALNQVIDLRWILNQIIVDSIDNITFFSDFAVFLLQCLD